MIDRGNAKIVSDEIRIEKIYWVYYYLDRPAKI